MARLKGLDASFLYFETPETPMHVAGLTLFELPDSYRGRFHQVYRDFLATRLEMAEIFRRKLANTTLALDHPSWVEDRAFDLDYHVRGIVLPAPGSFAQLEQTVARLHGTSCWIARVRSGNSPSSRVWRTAARRSIRKCITPRSMAAPAWF
ncbi:MAG: wax ester/triacylglycerol synthase domain-containing protein [Rhodospirillales bacterium]